MVTLKKISQSCFFCRDAERNAKSKLMEYLSSSFQAADINTTMNNMNNSNLILPPPPPPPFHHHYQYHQNGISSGHYQQNVHMLQNHIRQHSRYDKFIYSTFLNHNGGPKLIPKFTIGGTKYCMSMASPSYFLNIQLLLPFCVSTVSTILTIE